VCAWVPRVWPSLVSCTLDGMRPLQLTDVVVEVCPDGADGATDCRRRRRITIITATESTTRCCSPHAMQLFFFTPTHDTTALPTGTTSTIHTTHGTCTHTHTHTRLRTHTWRCGRVVFVVVLVQQEQHAERQRRRPVVVPHAARGTALAQKHFGVRLVQSVVKLEKHAVPGVPVVYGARRRRSRRERKRTATTRAEAEGRRRKMGWCGDTVWLFVRDSTGASELAS
jgi:hypothetical protein